MEVRWRADDDIGVLFLTGQEPSSTPVSEFDLVQRVNRLETELAALRAIVARLADTIQLH